MKRFLLFLLVIANALFTAAQQNKHGLFKDIQQQHSVTAGPNSYDSLYQQSLQELKLPENLKNAVLPAIVDNSVLPYLRSVIDQGMVPSCHQYAGVGYNFTYEMAHARNVPADTSINQYPINFTYNFEHFGLGFGSYFTSFEIIRKCGIMNVRDYGGLTDDCSRWITGYDFYYNGMHNRIADVYSIKTNTEQGILALKNWVYNHMGESQTGGVANFMAGSPWNAKQLPEGTPEQGRFVMTSFSAPGHSMTIVGYNDSIRYDYNNDGKYTRDVDLNNDGIINVKDWETGGFKFVNSYGNASLDSGFCYMMYRTLAEDYDHGGIWNNAVHVLKVKPDYSPLLTMKIRLKHNNRSSLRVKAGVSSDASALMPAQVIDFPVFNFQGGSFPMQGEGASDTLNTIEFGLDITPLLSFSNPHKETAFFLIVDENDPFSQSDGSIEYFSVVDYSKVPPEMVACQQVPTGVANNGSTSLKVSLSSNANTVKINNTPLPCFTAGQPYSFQLTATDGQPPYKWALDYEYTKLGTNQPLAPFEGAKLSAPSTSGYITAVPLGFSFPFYGKKHDTIYVNINNGFLQFTDDLTPWPSLSAEHFILNSNRLIVPLANKSLSVNSAADGAWLRSDSASATIKWILSKNMGDSFVPYEFQVKLRADGAIAIDHPEIRLAPLEQFYSGISAGDTKNYDISTYLTQNDANRYTHTEYIPLVYPDGLRINQNGLVECTPSETEQVYNIPCSVTDFRNISNTKSFALTSGIKAELKFHAGNDSIIANGETVQADLKLTNLSSLPLSSLNASIRIKNSYVSLVDTLETISQIQANSTLVLVNAFRFAALQSAPDEQAFIIELAVGNSQNNWKQSIPAWVSAAVLRSSTLTSSKPGNELIEPGEVGEFQYSFQNVGHAEANNVVVTIEVPHTDVRLLTSNSQAFGQIGPGQESIFKFSLKTSDSTALGTRIPVITNLTFNNQMNVADTFYIRIGKAPALVIDLDPRKESAPTVFKAINDLGYISDYSSLISYDINEYQSLFISLGSSSSRYILSSTEGEVLSNYLDLGGCIYLESGRLWRDDPLTALFYRFNIKPVSKFHKYDTLTGNPNSFLQGLSFLNTGYLISMYYLEPVWGSVTLFDDEGYSCSIASDAGTYRTIGCLFDFKSMEGINPESSHEKLMQRYLDFFNIKQNVIGIDEPFSRPKAGTILVYPNPASDKARLTFTSAEPAPATIGIMDINGTTIATLKSAPNVNNTAQSIEWDLCDRSGQKVSPGLYLCRSIGKKEVHQGKILVR